MPTDVLRVLLALAVAFLLTACGSSDASGPVPVAKVDRFDAPHAMKSVEMQLSYGQRPAASPQLRRLATRLRRQLPRGHFEAIPGNPGMRNIVGSLPGKGKPIVVGAHYETINRPAGFVGANDGAAGTAAVIELARSLRKAKREPDAPAIRFVLFDGEEELAPTDDFYRDALRGSKAYAKKHADDVRYMILLDYIANKGLRLPREGSSNEALWEQIRTAAQDVGVGAVFPDTTGTTIFDDHTPFLRRGIPAVDLIDWSYPYSHTLDDTIDKLSVRSIDAVGEAMVEFLRH